jgi:hypothetical protein
MTVPVCPQCGPIDTPELQRSHPVATSAKPKESTR